MPNWVTNRIVFHGDQENIDKGSSVHKRKWV